MLERLDKILANLGYGTRKEVKALVKKGKVTVDDVVMKSSNEKADPEVAVIKVDGEAINYRKNIYIMMNKPDGVVSATVDNYDETVVDLLGYEEQVFKPFPVGRLDKDTVGLLFLTNDGELNHKLISPKYEVDKVYYAEIDKAVNEKDIKAFEKGITLSGDGYKCLPAKLEILNSTEDGSEVKVTVVEGKFHQIKRMFEARDKSVVYLKRIEFAGIPLDENLDEGTYRELTEEEVEFLRSKPLRQQK